MSLCVTLVHHHEDIKCKVVDKALFSILFTWFSYRYMLKYNYLHLSFRYLSSHNNYFGSSGCFVNDPVLTVI